jgi:hypothetical protein
MKGSLGINYDEVVEEIGQIQLLYSHTDGKLQNTLPGQTEFRTRSHRQPRTIVRIGRN